MAESNPYHEMSRRGTDLAAQYQRAVAQNRPAAEVRAIASKIFTVVTALARKFLKNKVRASKQTLSGVSAHTDDEDLLQELNIRVFKALNSGKYREQGNFKAWVFTIANNLLIDSLNYRKPKRAVPGPEAEGGAGGDGLPQRGQSSAKHVAYSLEDDGVGELAAPRAMELSLDCREIMNLILEGLRGVEEGPGSQVWVARAFLGKNEAELQELYGLKPDTSTSHFRRTSEKILKFIKEHEGYKGVALEGVRALVAEPILEEADLTLIADDSQQQILRLARMPDMTLELAAEQLGLSLPSAKKLLQDAIVSLSKVRVHRATPAAVAAAGASQDAWLWDEVGRMLAAYPEPAAQLRGDPLPEAAELAALCQVAVLLAFSQRGLKPPQSFGEMVGPRLQKDGLDATARSLGVERAFLRRLLAGGVSPDQLEPAVLGRLSSHFVMEPRVVAASLRAGAAAAPGGRTRGRTDAERARDIESVRRRVLSRIGKP